MTDTKRQICYLVSTADDAAIPPSRRYSNTITTMSAHRLPPPSIIGIIGSSRPPLLIIHHTERQKVCHNGESVTAFSPSCGYQMNHLRQLDKRLQSDSGTGVSRTVRQREQNVLVMIVLTVLKIMDAGYCLYVHIFMKNIKSLKPFNFNNSNQLMPDLRFQQSRRDN